MQHGSRALHNTGTTITESRIRHSSKQIRGIELHDAVKHVQYRRTLKNVYYVCTSKTLRRRIKNWKKNTNKNKHRYRFQAVQYSDWINVKKNRFELKHGFLRSAHTEQHSRATQPTNDTRTNSDNNLRVDNKKPGPQRCELMWSSRDRFASRRADRDVRWSVT